MPEVDLEAVRRGDERALSRVIDRYTSLVYEVAWGITRSHDDAEDVLQDIFIGLPEALAQFEGGNFPGWLKVMTSRRALTFVRAGERRKKYHVSLVASEPLESRTLSRIMVERALDQLDPKLRTVFVLKEIEGLSHAEIGEVIGLTAGASRIRLLRARQALCELLGPE